MATSGTDKLFYRDFKHVINYLETQKQLMDAHMVDFFTSNHWETLLPRNIRQDLESLPQHQLTSLPNACTESTDFERFGENLKTFLKDARLAQLKSFSWVKDQKEFTSENRVDFISHIMTPKKSYEVDVMSDVINRLVKQFQVTKILDLGSGKGYLSQHLALQYGLNVIGVDSSHSNTQNAAKRNGRLLKAWKGLARKFQREKVNASSNLAEGNITCGHLDSQPLGRSLDVGNTKDGYSESSSKYCNHITCPISHVCSHDDNNIHVDTIGLNKASIIDQQKASCVCNPMQSIIGAESKQPIVSEADVVESKHSTDVTCKSKLATEASSQETFSQSSVPSLNSQHCDSATHCDMLCRNMSGTSDGVTTGCNGMFIVGLHTCGDLAPMALRIFVSEASVRVICIVGCCYHLVSQEFGGGNKTDIS
ncbi:methyltransferase-like protein 25 isoform X2 [Orbicella faveolata]|uniref:methyltransferase-like protein 25 isoform X2 n=1 Tax=Orbicella faveolata TaxID=48498 RepID=UPI0009E63CE9|nr:methyltransferase-like protein 25 isoform X2 [Orbicella faveolata]